MVERYEVTISVKHTYLGESEEIYSGNVKGITCHPKNGDVYFTDTNKEAVYIYNNGTAKLHTNHYFATNHIFGITVDEKYVYWANADRRRDFNGIWRSPLGYTNSSETRNVEKVMRTGGNPYGLAIQGEYMWVSLLEGYIYRFKKTMDEDKTINIVSTPNSPHHIDIDNNTQWLYIAEEGAHRIEVLKKPFEDFQENTDTGVHISRANWAVSVRSYTFVINSGRSIVNGGISMHCFIVTLGLMFI
eukprot:TRINITY_DN2773_c2_g1_i2.p1 TRINITY_DN2773_c2_g1~~TRINITY_DN2773_c2_g1_i2.p1  ORF type:complete len:245 (+),score=54.69 TRINITY_DN2773_c2_g1_i2:241-975(+)